MKNVEGFETYMVSEDGAVFSGKRQLKYDITNVGYRRVTLCNKGKQKRMSVHRLVATTYIPNPDKLPCVNHLNGVKTDNSVSNLDWVSHSHNHIHAFATGLRPQAESAYQSKISNELVHKACKMIEDGHIRGDVLKSCVGLKKHMFDNIRRRRTWKSISCNYIW